MQPPQQSLELDGMVEVLIEYNAIEALLAEALTEQGLLGRYPEPHSFCLQPYPFERHRIDVHPKHLEAHSRHHQQELSAAGPILKHAASGGLDTSFDQGTGLDAVIVQQTLNMTGCTNTAAFIAQHVTSVANTTIAAANSPPYQNGIQWYSLSPAGTPLNTKLRQQGYPYENYVTTVLGVSYKQTVPNFEVFDHWNNTSFIAVSDKTLDTKGATYDYKINDSSNPFYSPYRITAQMIKYGIKMNNFVADGGESSPIFFLQDQIKSYGFQFTVPSTTNSAQWQAIREGYQDMMAMSNKALSITTNQVF